MTLLPYTTLFRSAAADEGATASQAHTPISKMLDRRAGYDAQRTTTVAQLTPLRAAPVLAPFVADLDLPVKVHGVPTIREADGLARSSRNHYLSDEERALAGAVPAALAAGVTAADLGRSADAVVGAAELELMRVGLTPDYVALTDPALGPAAEVGPARLLLATRVGQTLLIDNTPVTLRR